MFRLIKLIVALVGLAAFVWFGANVPLGSRTLFEHLQAIGRTHETQELLDGTRETAKPLMDGVRKRLGVPGSGTDDSTTAAADGGPPADEIWVADRDRLRKLLAGQHHGR